MGIKNFNVMDLGRAGIIKPEQLGYRDSLDIIKDESFKIQKSFVKIGWYLKHIRDNELYKEDGYANIWECAADQLGYSQSTASRFINICEKFSKDHNSPELDAKYTGFDKSQMIEMLPMEPGQLDKVTPDMTVKQIRDIKLKDKAEKDENDFEIPGQTSIAEDFPEYMPAAEEQDAGEVTSDSYATSHKDAFDRTEEISESLVDSDEEATAGGKIIDASYREIKALEPEPETNLPEEKIQEPAQKIMRMLEDKELKEDAPEKEEVQPLFKDNFTAAKYILEQEKKTLDDFLEVGGLPEMTVLRQKIIVAALEDFLKNAKEI